MTGYVCQILWKECGKHCPNLLNPVYARNMSSKFFMKKKKFVVKKLSFIHSKSDGFVLRHIEVPVSLIAIGTSPFGQFLRLPR